MRIIYLSPSYHMRGGITTKDNYDFYRQHEAEEEEWLRSRPVCACCGEPIQDEYMYEIDGWYCEECKDIFLANIRKNVDDFVDQMKGGW